MKKIKLMPEYQCFPLWDVETGDNIDPQELGLSESLCEQVYELARVYDQFLNSDNPSSSSWTKDEKNEFIKNFTTVLNLIQDEISSSHELQKDLMPYPVKEDI